MGRPKGSKNKPKIDTPKKIVATKSVKVKNEKVDEEDEEEESNYPVNHSAIEAQKELQEKMLDPFKVHTIQRFECEFVKFTQWQGMIKEEPDETREGRYCGCYFPVDGCNFKFWPVLGYIKTDIDRLRSAGYDDKTIFAGCINYLSEQGTAKKRKYGNLLPYRFSVNEDKLIVTFFTDIRKVPLFWGEGV